MSWLALYLSILVPNAASQSAPTSQTFSDISLALQSIRQRFGISTGFERSIGDPNVAVTLDLSANEPGRVLDSLIAQRSAYVWSLDGGVYCVYPRIPGESLSQLVVANYSVRNVTLFTAQQAVYDLPEVKKWLSDRQSGVLIAGSSLMIPRDSPAVAGEPRISLTLYNAPLRTVLSQIATGFAKGRWSISHLRTGQEEAVQIQF
jgi:hypothetical protein